MKFGEVTYIGRIGDGQFSFTGEPAKTVTPTMYIYKFTESIRTLPIRCKEDQHYFKSRKEFAVNA